ncbi:MAG: PQQ-binding-like beta-propeller repeat protein [Pirellulales bacterium]|nr:PQQ-binding-like beta-propeller repeat protein [Pirellulales bacterium]
MRLRPVLAAALLALAAPRLHALENAERNWHQWRGPLATGVAPQGDPPTHWDPQTNIKWKTPIPGRGSASPIVWEDRIFVLTAVDTGRPAAAPASADPLPPAAEPPSDEQPGGRRFGRSDDAPRNIHQFMVLCLDRRTGEVLWQRIAREAAPHEGMHQTNSYASGSPTTDGKLLYASFGSQGIYCYDLDGNLKWAVDLGDMQTRNSFGEGASPTLHLRTLLAPWDHEGQSKLYALDADSGERLWEVDRDEPTTWNTPLVVDAAGRKQVVLNGTNRARSYDFETGELMWECGGQGTNPIASPVAYQGLAICMTGHRQPAIYAIPLDARGDVSGTDKIAWHKNEPGPYVPSPLLYGDRLYYTKANTGVLSCVAPRTGLAAIDQQRLPGVDSMYASPVAAAGRVYFTSRSGATVVLRDGDKLEVLAANNVGEPVDASPAIVGHEMFIRGEKHLFCIREE